jgi:hypothetical protein
MGDRVLWATVIGAVILALPVAATAAPSQHVSSVPFVTVAGGGNTDHPRRNRVFLARSLAATDPWRRWLSVRARNALRNLNFDHYGVIAVFRMQKSTGLKITRIERASHTLALRLTVPKTPAAGPKPCHSRRVPRRRRQTARSARRVTCVRASGNRQVTGILRGPVCGNVTRQPGRAPPFDELPD